MNPYIIHCDRISQDSYAVRAIRFDTCRIVSSYSTFDPYDARIRANAYSRTFAHEGEPAPIIYAPGAQS